MSDIFKNHGNKNLVLVDGYGFVFRAYHSMPPLTTTYGLPVGALYGFTNMLYKLRSDANKDDHIIIIFDSGEKNFRHQIYHEYKANRPPAPDDLILQFPLLREAVDALNLEVYEKIGFEADDVIATMVKKAKEENIKVTIVSSDKDLMQLVDDNVQMYDPIKTKIIGINEVKEKFGVFPDKVRDVLALMGDSSDNIPGVPGIGPKTAAELVNEYGGIEEVLANTHKIKQNKRRETLQENIDKARLSYQLVGLSYDVQIDKKISEMRIADINEDNLIEFVKKYEFKNLLKRLVKNTPEQPQQKIKLINIKDEQNLDKFIKYCILKKKIALNIHNIDNKISNIIIADESNLFNIYVTEEEHNNLGDDLFSQNITTNIEAINLNIALSKLKILFESPSLLKIGYDLKLIYKLLKKHNIEIIAFADIMLQSYALGSGHINHELLEIIDKYHETINDNIYQQLKNLTTDKKYQENIEYKLLITEEFLKLHNYLENALKSERKLFLYNRIELALVKVLGDMEIKGIIVNPLILATQSQELEQKANEIAKKIYNQIGFEFNIGSPKQLGEALFDKLQIPYDNKKAKSGAYTTSADVLEELVINGYEIARWILDWRGLTKLKNTYTDSLPKEISPIDKRIHTNFSMAATATGRLSSNNPNLQNIPIRTEEGQKIRAAFIADKGYKLISADYSQIELRLLAHIANIPELKHAFANRLDIHSATASQIFHVPLDQVDANLRRKAKTINFGIIYGISAFGLAKQLLIPRHEAAEYIKQYFAKFPGILEYMEKMKEHAKTHGYVETIYGRRCYTPTINDNNAALRGLAERAAINAPFQGTAADIIKLAMIKLADYLTEHNYKSKILLQIHDELIIESPENEAEKVAKITQNIMQSIVSLSVPIEVSVGIGNNWQEIH